MPWTFCTSANGMAAGTAIPAISTITSTPPNSTTIRSGWRITAPRWATTAAMPCGSIPAAAPCAALAAHGAAAGILPHGVAAVRGCGGACDLTYSSRDFLPVIQAGGFNNYGPSGPQMESVTGYSLVVCNARTEYFYSPDLNDVVGYLPIGRY